MPEEKERAPHQRRFAKRSRVMGTNGAVAASDPLATLAGLKILMEGGNAVDAAVTVSLMQNVTNTSSTGIGGDLFMLIYLAKTREVKALNASGRAPYAATLEAVEKLGYRGRIPRNSIHAATVPGATHGYEEALRQYGTMSFKEVLRDPIHYAEHGYPVSEMTTVGWQLMSRDLGSIPSFKRQFTFDDRTPRPGEIFRNPQLARTLRLLAEGGRDAFYRGPIAEAIVRYSDEHGGFFTLRDFAEHTSTWVEPAETTYRGYRVLEAQPNSQGIAALLMLNLLEGFDLRGLGHNSAEYVHLCLEAKKLAFADRDEYVADPDVVEVPIRKLLSTEYTARRRAIINHDRAADPKPGDPFEFSDTIYTCAADKQGNVVSLISSLFFGFGCGHVPGELGFPLQCRGIGFHLERGHRNCIAPHKRHMHTITPALVLSGERPLMALGVVGGHMQTQAQQQIISNALDFGMSIQEAIDAPRFRHMEGLQGEPQPGVVLDPAIPAETGEGLKRRGHRLVTPDVLAFWMFGGAQAIRIDPENGVYQGGSDCRFDGCAMAH